MDLRPEADGPLSLATAASLGADEVLARLGASRSGLSSADAEHRLAQYGPNALRTHGTLGWRLLRRQLDNPLLLLLSGAALISGFTGDVTDAAIIGVIVTISVGLSFFNEFRSEQAVEALHSQLRHNATVRRDGAAQRIDVVALVPGDIVSLQVGDVVPADLRLLDVVGLECDESIISGESLPLAKQTAPVPAMAGALGLPSCAYMGTIVRDGTATGVVVGTGSSTSFGRIAVALGERHEQTAFQLGLHQFSSLLVRVAGALTVAVFAINLILHRPFLEALLFSLAIAIGITPQLLPAIVTVSLATGTRRLANKGVLVKRLVSIEDLGNLTLLFTDKTGTLTEGRVSFDKALDAEGERSDRAHLLGLLCNEAVVEDGRAVSGNQLDLALWDAAGRLSAEAAGWTRLGLLPFDYERRLSSVVVRGPDGTAVMITKGAPEALMARCAAIAAQSQRVFDELSDAGARVIAVASKPPGPITAPTAADEHDLSLEGFLVFVDPLKRDALSSLQRLATLGVTTKVITGDSDRVARKVCGDLGFDVTTVLTGDHVDALSDADLAAAIGRVSVFARTAPDQKARIVRVARTTGADVGFLGDGVNDAVALYKADVGISVDTATDVAKDAADIVLLSKDLGVLADGIQEGRRIFANTIKYVLMATSSNFGNMFSAAGASMFLSYLPMLPSQILLNNMLYDIGQMTIPTDRVDTEMLARPSQWDIHFIRRFMSLFGPISSLFDFATFGILLGILHASQHEFRTGWFVESLATQSLVIFVIRTRRVPFFRSRPSRSLLVAILATAAVGATLPFSPLASDLGFTKLPPSFFALLVALIALYLVLAQLGTRWFFASAARLAAVPPRPVAIKPHQRRVHRRAARFSRGPLTVVTSPRTRARRRQKSATRTGARPR